jgi:proteasome assembly chaperone (PAC2) family protein
MKDISDIKSIINKIDYAISHRATIDKSKEYVAPNKLDPMSGIGFLGNLMAAGVDQYINADAAEKMHLIFCETLIKELTVSIEKNVELLKRNYGVLYERPTEYPFIR